MSAVSRSKRRVDYDSQTVAKVLGVSLRQVARLRERPEFKATMYDVATPGATRPIWRYVRSKIDAMAKEMNRRREAVSG